MSQESLLWLVFRIYWPKFGLYLIIRIVLVEAISGLTMESKAGQTSNNFQKNVLIAGWFSFEFGHATAGDILALNLTCEWIHQAGYHYDVAFDLPFDGGVNWRTVDPSQYSHVVFVCGPFEQGQYEADFLGRFHHCRLIGLNLSMLVSLDKWKPFDFLLERNSSTTVRADMVFLAREPHVPVVGVCLVEPYPKGLVSLANAAIDRLIDLQKIAVVYIDTRLDCNSTHLRSPAEIESLIARVDVLITTRLHGTVLALKNKIPVIAIDPEAGGDKIRRQVEKIGWPILFTADALSDEALCKAFEYCLTEEARNKAQECAAYAIGLANEMRNDFISELVNPVKIDQNFKARLANSRATDWMTPLASVQQADGESAWKESMVRSRKTLKKLAYWTLPRPIYNLFFSEGNRLS